MSGQRQTTPPASCSFSLAHPIDASVQAQANRAIALVGETISAASSPGCALADDGLELAIRVVYDCCARLERYTRGLADIGRRAIECIGARINGQHGIVWVGVDNVDTANKPSAKQ